MSKSAWEPVLEGAPEIVVEIVGCGASGKDGADGFSPVVSVSVIDGGHRIAIKDANGEKTVDVLDGKDGNNGVYVGSGDMPDDCNVQIDPDGEVLTHEDLKGDKGDPGPQGKPGYTPKRGVDYWTDEDVANIVIDAADKAVEIAIGDIDTVLDSILAIQNSYIGGEA
jgi:hypothetical protein